MARNMNVNVRSPEEDAGFVKLMVALAFAPTMQSFTGHAESDRFFNKLTENAIATGANAFSRLKSKLSNHNVEYDKALLLFKGTLQSVRLTFNGYLRGNVVGQIPNFRNLKNLYLQLAINNVVKLNTRLEKCPPGRKLEHSHGAPQ